MSDGDNRRRHARYAYSAPADLIRGKKVAHLETVDVSFSGLFLRTDEPPPLRELVKIRLELPSDGEEAMLLGMAVHRVPPGGPRTAGIGVLLYGLDPALRARWERFVQEVRMGKHGRGPTDDLPLPESPPPQRALRPELRIQVPGEDALKVLRDRDLVRSRTFVRTELYLEPGTTADVLFVHPDSAREFRISGRVAKQVRRPGLVGLALELDGLDAQTLAAFDDFAQDEIHVTVDVELDPSVDVFDES